MNIRKAALIGIALAAALVFGTVGVATAATSPAATPAAGFGARMGSVVRQAGGTLADIVARLTGQTNAEVYAQRADGTSFADIAKAKGVSADQIAADAIAARKTALASAVKAGTITQAQADRMLANMQSRIAARVSSPAPSGCDGTGSGAGRGAGGGCGGGGCGLGGGRF